jgi:hypothetical protein
MTDAAIRTYLAGIPAGRRLLHELERLRRRDAENTVGETILLEPIAALSRRIEVLQSAVR